MSKLTVIIPLLQKSEHLEECMQSIAAQELRNMDVLFVMDTKSEEVVEEIAGYSSRYASQFPVRQVVCDEDHGLAAARNCGLFQAKGEYVYFMEPEDLLEPGTLRALLDAVPNLPAPLVYTRVKPLHRLVSGYHEEYEEEIQLLFETDAHRLSQRPAMDQAAAVYDRPAKEYMVELRDDLEDFTVLGCLFSRSFLKENDILFSTQLKLYPDAPFICKVLINAEQTVRVDSGAYIRRSGTFRYPAERQLDWKGRLNEYMLCYDKAYSYCTSNLEMMLLVQETMCSRYVNVVVRLISKSRDREFTQSIYDIFAKQMKRVDKRVVASFGRAERKHLKLLLEGDSRNSIAYMKSFIRHKKREYLFQRRSNVVRMLAEKLFGNMDTLERYIVFESGKGQRYYGDPKYIYRYLMEHYPGEYRCIWVANDKELAGRIDGKCKTVKRDSFRYFYYILRAKYWIKDTRQPIWWYKSKDQVYISTWLGTPMQKLFLDKEAFLKGDPALKRGLKAQVEQWDALISGNAYSTAHFQSGLGAQPEQILEIGNPRNDYLVGAQAQQEKERLKLEMGLPMDKKTILYAPVWREEEATDVEGCYKMQLGLHRMKEQLEKDYIVLVRIHDYITGRVILDKALEGFVYDFSFYDDVQELMLISDILVTDYSSMVFDYACLRRPIFFYLYDEEAYRANAAHFYDSFEPERLPGPCCHTTQEIIDYIRALPAMEADYKERYDAFYDQFCSLAGDSAQRLARRLLTEMADVFAYEDSGGLQG